MASHSQGCMAGFPVPSNLNSYYPECSILIPFPGKGSFGSVVKTLLANAGDLGSIPGLRRSPGEGKGYPLQYSGLENSIDCIVHEVTKSRTLLPFTFTLDV